MSNGNAHRGSTPPQHGTALPFSTQAGGGGGGGAPPARFSTAISPQPNTQSFRQALVGSSGGGVPQGYMMTDKQDPARLAPVGAAATGGGVGGGIGFIPAPRGTQQQPLPRTRQMQAGLLTHPSSAGGNPAVAAQQQQQQQPVPQSSAGKTAYTGSAFVNPFQQPSVSMPASRSAAAAAVAGGAGATQGSQVLAGDSSFLRQLQTSTAASPGTSFDLAAFARQQQQYQQSRQQPQPAQQTPAQLISSHPPAPRTQRAAASPDGVPAFATAPPAAGLPQPASAGRPSVHPMAPQLAAAPTHQPGQPPFASPPQPRQQMPFQIPQPMSRHAAQPLGAAVPPVEPNFLPPHTAMQAPVALMPSTAVPAAAAAAAAAPVPFSGNVRSLGGVPAAAASPTVLLTDASGAPVPPQSLSLQQVLQRMGIPAQMATAPAAMPMDAPVVPSAVAKDVAANNAVPPPQPLSQRLQHQQQQQVPLNFYAAPTNSGGSSSGPQRGFPSQQQQQRQQQQYQRQQGPGRWDDRGRGDHHQQQQQQQQHRDPLQVQQQQHGRGFASPPGYASNAAAAAARAPPAPVSQLTAPDPEMLQRFKEEYAQQEEPENVSDELKAQQATRLGTVGTLDEEVCLSLIESHDVTFVVTETGTGKSTRIPIALHKAHPDALIVNAQPRRTAAINLAQRVAELLEAKLGEEVGYSVRGEHIGELGETKVMYATTYSLFIYFLWHKFEEKLPFTYIIVDEFHERTPDVEVILLILKLWLKKHPKAFKLILCSATAQVEQWESFFDGLNVGTYFRSPIMYPVREYYIEDLQKLVGFRTAPIAPHDSNNMVATEQMHQLILVCKQLLQYLAKNTAAQDSVLVFMPGRTQVELMTTWMRDHLEGSVEPVAWYRDVELSVIQEALARPAVTRKKVYVATDIAEVSLTLPDVVFVIDSGTGKRPQVSAKEQTSYAFPPLRLLWETASNAQQRRGRVGRVQQGFYFSLLSREHHHALRGTENRIKNAVLTELVLHSLLITEKPFAFFQLCNERPENGALSYSMHLLQDGGLIIAKDEALAEAERVALDRTRTHHVMDSPWNGLIEEALTAAHAASLTQEKSTAAAEVTHPPAPSASAEAKSAPAATGAVMATEGDAAEEEDDGDDVQLPEVEGSAFDQCYYMTLRGVIAARSPVSVAAATNIFYGLLCGTPTLSMLAAAIESSKSPFYVPYTISDRAERAGMTRAVSQLMMRYHGSLQSDLICAMEVILEYMSMQRDGLSEEAQEEWCQERSVSRTRVVDTLNLFAQMKEQVSSVLPFPDVTDIDVLTAQFNQNAELLVLMLVASHTQLAIQVQLDGPVAQRKGFVGHGMFFPLKCLKDESVPTVCPWDRTKISVPLSLQTIQRKVLAGFASQVEPDLFALVVLIFSFKLRYSVLDKAPTPSYLFSVSHFGVRRTFQCDVLTAQQILQLRRIQCAQLRCMQLQVEERVNANESEKLSAVLKSAKSDFGLPASAVETPYLIPTVLQHGLKLLVGRLRSSPSFSAMRLAITDFPAGTAFCKLQHTMELTPPISQSVLIHSSNGLSVVDPVAQPAAAAPAEAEKTAASAAAQPATAAAASATTAAAAAAATAQEKADDGRSDAEVDDDMSEKSSESDSEVHVATFRYDL